MITAGRAGARISCGAIQTLDQRYLLSIEPLPMLPLVVLGSFIFCLRVARTSGIDHNAAFDRKQMKFLVFIKPCHRVQSTPSGTLKPTQRPVRPVKFGRKKGVGL